MEDSKPAARATRSHNGEESMSIPNKETRNTSHNNGWNTPKRTSRYATNNKSPYQKYHNAFEPLSDEEEELEQCHDNSSDKEYEDPVEAETTKKPPRKTQNQPARKSTTPLLQRVKERIRRATRDATNTTPKTANIITPPKPPGANQKTARSQRDNSKLPPDQQWDNIDPTYQEEKQDNRRTNDQQEQTKEDQVHKRTFVNENTTTAPTEGQTKLTPIKIPCRHIYEETSNMHQAKTISDNHEDNKKEANQPVLVMLAKLLNQVNSIRDFGPLKIQTEVDT